MYVLRYMHTCNSDGYYTPKDLRVGGVISVFGRQMMINDADASTMRYYQDVLGIDFLAANRSRGVSAR